jgi:hypothetical protein
MCPRNIAFGVGARHIAIGLTGEISIEIGI